MRELSRIRGREMEAGCKTCVMKEMSLVDCAKSTR